MNYKESDNFSTAVQHALGLPIRARCAELAVLLDRASLLELHSFFPVLLDNIFAPQGGVPWGLRSIIEDTNGFRELQHFFSPAGPVFKLIYTLLKDPNIKYDFPLSYLPVKTRQYLESSSLHPFYSELIHVNPQTKQTVSLLLNPFDYYMFHFAFHLINPWQQRIGSAVTYWNTAYYVISCDYILYFLPTNPTTVIHPVIYYNGKNPLQAIKCNFQEQQPKNSGLINKKTLTKTKDDSAFQQNLDIHHPRNDIWRSETVLTIFTDMWLHSNQVSHDASSFNTSSMGLLHHNELPTGEYMRIVRVLIKRIHSFSASANADDTHMAELKRIALPMIQGKFYVFLRNLIHRWPLDGSFRLVLELWLTYIQPWRYPPDNLVKYLNKQENNVDVDDISIAQQGAVDGEYIPFIAENFLAYTIIFQQLLPRFGRVDLVSPKMSLMLYRMTKVFAQPNLPNFLRRIEQCLLDTGNQSDSIGKFSSTQWNPNLPPLSPTSSWSSSSMSLKISPIVPTATLQRKSFSPILNSTSTAAAFLDVGNTSPTTDRKWSAIVRQKIFELEGPNFCYKPLFADPPADEVYNLVLQIRRSKIIADELVKQKKEEEELSKASLWIQIKSLLNGSVSNDEFPLKERERVPSYLKFSLKHLIEMFNISNDSIELEQACVASVNDNSNNGFDMSNDFKFLTPQRVRDRIKNIRYEGDPDLHPIRSTEFTVLVRTLYQLAKFLNERYGPNFYQFYHSSTLMGRIWRQILCPPMVVYKYDKTKPGSPRVSSNLPPRISLRFMATYRFWFYFFFGYVLACLFGYSMGGYLMFLVLLFFIVKLYKALRSNEMPVRHNYPTQGFGNISFNDSF